ncbi:hypothetical protein StoSoilB19_34520 [Arthrobacter sp. StoSoilB19]|jgi:formylglycine-generating enzyme required for sulfatase activity|nr:hypothetical protein StoSoilB19_34520 [Arthrobacter sp. StoSoilB19]
MKSIADGPQDAANQDVQQVAAPNAQDSQGKVAEWTSDCLLTLRSPIRFTRADWP